MKKFITPIIAVLLITTPTLTYDDSNDAIHNAVHNNSFRLESDSARDQFRHPEDLLRFAGITASSTVIEVNPGGGWYTRIIAPLVKDKGQYIGLEGNPSRYSGNYAANLMKLPAKIKDNAALYGTNAIGSWLETEPADFEVGSVDVAIAVRTFHNFARRGYLQSGIAYLHAALKQGGHLVVVQHRINEDYDGDHSETTKMGRWKQSELIAAVEAQGFKFVASNEMNANNKDPHNMAVWQLPPSNSMASENGGKYKNIGESDRMTVKFVKVAK